MSSSVSCGIVGLPNVGKSTLFSAITKNNVLTANYPFATIEPNTGIVQVPDSRLIKLADIYNTNKIVPATVTFVDIAGLVAGASKGEGLGNQFLGHIRSCSAIIEVVRNFSDPDIVHVDKEFSPTKDIDTINTELVLADLQTVDHRLPKLQKEVKSDPKLRPALDTLLKVQRLLNDGQIISSEKDLGLKDISDLQLITAKPIVYAFNSDEQHINNKARQQELSSLVSPAKAIFIAAKIESELSTLDDVDAQELLASYGQQESGLIQLIHTAYDILHLQSFLTAGQKEVRAWTIPKGSTAQQAAGVIHTDFARGFIAADIVSYSDLVSLGSLAAARAAGLIRSEGKSYIMQPDDIVDFKFNV